jgi:glutamate 5-kinase
VIAPGHRDDVLDRLFAGEAVGTWFFPSDDPMRGVRRWIDSAAVVAGRIFIDAGAARALVERKASLLSIGITHCLGEFRRGDVVAICDPHGHEVARGLSNYRATEVSKIAGVLNDCVAEVLTHRGYDVVVHCDNMVVAGRHVDPLPASHDDEEE